MELSSVLVRTFTPPRLAPTCSPNCVGRFGNHVCIHFPRPFHLLTSHPPRSVIHVLGESACLTMLRILAHCLYSVQRGGRVEIIANDQGHRITPSWVGFTEDERLYVSYFSRLPLWLTNLSSVGDSAKNAFHSNPENTVFDAKRLIGRKMDDNELKRDMKHWPFSVVDKAGKPAIQINYKSETREFVSLFMLFGHPRKLSLPRADARGDQCHGFDKDEGDCRGIPW